MLFSDISLPDIYSSTYVHISIYTPNSLCYAIPSMYILEQ